MRWASASELAIVSKQYIWPRPHSADPARANRGPLVASPSFAFVAARSTLHIRDGKNSHMADFGFVFGGVWPPRFAVAAEPWSPTLRARAGAAVALDLRPVGI